MEEASAQPAVTFVATPGAAQMDEECRNQLLAIQLEYASQIFEDEEYRSLENQLRISLGFPVKEDPQVPSSTSLSGLSGLPETLEGLQGDQSHSLLGGTIGSSRRMTSLKRRKRSVRKSFRKAHYG